MSIERTGCIAAYAVLALAFAMATAQAASLPQLNVSLVENPEVVFDMMREDCTPSDVMPDINARAFRDSSGEIVFFGLHSTNRVLRGRDLSHLKLDCHIVLDSGNDPNPAHYNDRNFITATWTGNGRDVAALVHHEYHADDFDRCRVKDALGCWYNTVVAYRSGDEGRDFSKGSPLVVAAAPFTQDVGQGRHRGFFNPSNIFSDGHYEYFFAATTGWDGQPYGACLFRSATPLDSGSWRAYDGHGFSIRYTDPYLRPDPGVKACAQIGPFLSPVGAVVRLHRSRDWLAVFEAGHNDTFFPVDGIYYATAHDLLHWSLPKLLRAGPTISSDACTTNIAVSYPSILADDSTGRNFDNAGEDDAFLYFVAIPMKHCQAGPRLLLRQKLKIAPEAG
jgi:hypothetical protein